jgi:hypothetical protein
VRIIDQPSKLVRIIIGHQCYTIKYYTVEDGIMECASEGNSTG